MHHSIDEVANSSVVSGDSYRLCHPLLRDCIIKHDYNTRGIHLNTEEIFINRGVKNEIGNISEILIATMLLESLILVSLFIWVKI